ncbi:MAG TPA: endonuclease/exonuclease/phosphatase family protein [Candidatus Cloacimonadota bacterium]|nr:endonuclease/exonuclease/phosphatase family protein [Candidatus Cloacimonadota bacterium]
MRFKYLLLILLTLILVSCGQNNKLTPPPTDEVGLLFGSPETLDIVSWNLKTFPLTNNTVNLLRDIIPQMNVDVIAFQEVMEQSQFYALAEAMPDYEAYVYNATSSYRLAYLYDSRTVTVNDAYTIFNGQSNPFPRPPYILDINFANQNYLIINNHFKALGDNFIDETDDWDDEYRRRLASTLLEEYIRENFNNDRVVMLGDLNDQIQEPTETNVFLPFLNRPDDYLFTTMPIATNPTPNTVSYPSYNSILDHILISDELFSDFALAGNYCRVIRVENHVGGLSAYYSLISDHRPIGIRLQAN